MKIGLVVLLAVTLALTSGCMDIGGAILDDMFGWIPGYEGSSSGSGTRVTGAVVQDETSDPLAMNRIDSLDMEEFCKHMPNTYYDGKGCVCKDGFEMYMGVCQRTSGAGQTPQAKECVFDQDCSPSGADRAVCSGAYNSLRYRCDLRMNTCIPRKGAPAENIDCRVEFGAGYVCRSGMCVRG